MPGAPALLDRLRGTVGVLYRELIKFGVVGGVAFIIDVGLFNLLRHTALEDKPSTAKVISAGVATLVAWIGNRMWTFRRRRNRPVHHEALLFFVTNGVALLIGVGVIAFSHYVLDLKSLSADNVANLIGIALGTLFRFWAYRTFVFSREPLEDTSPLAER
ncbi:GtrA family protein [Knoellia koreensis]|uniref:GtrA family protein n=1 Tax=Knoellia koreensis TaxID=2730921 RepID=A0A849HJB7_9MICO|nr:GtrA family protein [Knoellia sp. DB2414S]